MNLVGLLKQKQFKREVLKMLSFMC